jgi:hypothetical protein
MFDSLALPIVDRIIYAIHRHDVLEQLKTMLALAAVLIAWAVPPIGESIGSVWTVVEKYL